MLSIKGCVINTFKAPKGVNKKGEEYGGQDKVQILGDLQLPDGSVKKELVTLTCEDSKAFEKVLSQEVSIPVGVMVFQGSPVYYIPKGASYSF